MTDPEREALRTIAGTLDDLIRFAEAQTEQAAFAHVRVTQLAGMKEVAEAALSPGPEPVAGLEEERLAEALHGQGGSAVDSGTCANWAPGWGDECGPDKHMDEARRITRRYAALGKKP